eukprot:COSAG06_NODE_4570_length_4137_cov_1.758791_5_plen_112_part_00
MQGLWRNCPKGRRILQALSSEPVLLFYATENILLCQFCRRLVTAGQCLTRACLGKSTFACCLCQMYPPRSQFKTASAAVYLWEPLCFVRHAQAILNPLHPVKHFPRTETRG